MLELKNLQVAFDEKTIFRDVHMTLKPGEITVLTGHSGCGKSTLIRLLNGVIPHMTDANIQGEILYNGKNILPLSIEERSAFISTVFQNPKSQFYALQSTDEIAFAMENRGIPREEILSRIKKYATLLHAEALLDRPLLELSGGEKQLVAILSVACLEQDVYIFDEPSSSLDAASIARLKEALILLKKMGKIILVAEHRLYYLADIFDQFLVLADGVLHHYNQNTLNDSVIAQWQLRTLEQLTLESVKKRDMPYRQVALCSTQDEEGKLLCAHYCFNYRKGKPVLNCSIGWQPGIHFIVGANGVGKSTFLRYLCRLEKNRKGSTYYAHKELRKMGQWISLVMQDVNMQLFTDSVWSEISIVSQDAAFKEKILRDLELWDKREAHPQSLSGGEKQRLTIALCKASPKPIVIFDEPTSGLCKKSMQKTIELIHDIANQGKTILITTHDMEFIQACGGQIVEFVRN